jgi:glycine/D-amino acid oxidase-like deaminating enzyme
MAGQGDRAGSATLPAREAAQAGPKHAVYWWETEPVVPGPPLQGTLECDVCIVGGGYTGMWAAHFLKQAEPSIEIAVVESHWAGAGASGHNDGYAMTVLDMSLHHLVTHHGSEKAGAAHEAVAQSIVEMAEFCRQHGVDAEMELSGFVSLATNKGQLWRLERDLEAARKIGADHDYQLFDAEGARGLVGSPIVQGALKEGRGAILNPHKLARGLARVVRDQGVTIHERTPALDLELGEGKPRVVTPGGKVTADQVVVATNAYQHSLKPFRGKVIPLWSYAMVSEPLSDEQLGRVAWPGREGFEDKRNYITIGRLTADNRFLWAGRLAPYFFGNDMDLRHMRNPRVHGELREAFDRYFPMWKDVRFTHAYGGCVAVTPSFVPLFGRGAGGLVYGYGYNGHGVAPSHTGGKILRDLVLGRDTPYTNLLFVNGKERAFPPEPIRFIGARLTERLLERQDRRFDQGKGEGEMDPLLLRLLR